MSLDVSKIVSLLGEHAIGEVGEPLGLKKEQSVRVAKALAANFNKGKDQAVKAAAEDANLGEEVVSAMLSKLMEKGREKILDESGMTGAMDKAKDDAMAALSDGLGKASGGLLGGLFGKKK